MGVNIIFIVIMNFIDVVFGKIYIIYGNGDKNVSMIVVGGNFVFILGMIFGMGKFIRLVKVDDGKFYEVVCG